MTLILIFIVFLIFGYVVCDVNYFVRTLLSVLCGKVIQEKVSLKDVTSIYGMCTFQDCDISFKSMRLARIIRELDFARFHFYVRAGVYQRSQELNIKSLQGCTQTVIMKDVPLFKLYRIDSKLVYWDECSLFFDHEVVTLSDGEVRMFLVSRQHAIGPNGNSTDILLQGLPGSQERPHCPEHIKCWIDSMAVTSAKLRPNKD